MVDSNQHCPGRDLRSLKILEFSCSRCGYGVEFFSDERKRTCPKCGAIVQREGKPTCAEWCSSAETCALLRGLRPDEET